MLSNPIFGPLTLLCIQNCWLPGSPKKIGCGFRWRFAIVCFCMCSAFFLALVASKSWPLLGPSWSACSMRASPGSDLSAPDLDHPQIVVGSQSISSRQRTRDVANTPAFARSKHQRRKIRALSSAKWSRTRLTNSLRQAIRARQDRIGTSEPIRWPPAGCRATPARTANVKLRYEPHRRENCL